ncbi:MAG TPA: LysE family transporter [Spirochaetota bacterium]|nr:LysE family transporter [Spirochaetota bacterium]
MSGLSSLLTIFISSFVIALSGAMMPGPLLTATISESTRRGFTAGPLMIAGHAILELVLVALLLMGLASFLQLPEVFAVTALAGSVILAWMAYMMVSSLSALTLFQQGDSLHRNHLVLTGIFMSLANPYWIIWWATIGLGYIMYSWKFGIPGVAFFFTGHILADLAWYSFISAAVAGGRNFITDRVYRGLIALLSLFLVLFAAYFAYEGFMKLKEIIV